MVTPLLHTTRLELTPLREADAAEMADVLAAPALYAFTGGEPPDAHALRERFGRLVIGRSPDGREIWHNWIVRVNATGAAVGTVQATVSAVEPVAEIAWVISVPWQGLGYASEAAQALVEWLDREGATTIIAHIHPEHHASSAVAARAGLVPTDEIADGERVWRRTRRPRTVRPRRDPGAPGRGAQGRAP